MKNDLDKYDECRTQTENFYNGIGKIKCPILGDYVVFSSEGFNHLVYKNKSERTKNDQMTKFKLLPSGKKIIGLTTTVQEYTESLIEVRRKKMIRGKRRPYIENVIAKYWCFSAIIDGLKIKVIVRQVGEGNKHFWSVIPDWNISKYSDIKMIKKYRGDPEED